MAAKKFTTAAANGDLDTVKHLLSSDKDGGLLECFEEAGNTALICACANGQEKVVRYLLSRGAHLHSYNNYGWTALMAASYYGHCNIVTKLLQNKNSRPNYMSKELCCTPLHCAARCNNIQVAELLILKGAQVDISPMIASCEDDCESLHSGDVIGRWYMSPLMIAVKHGHDAMVSLLVAKGADVNFKEEMTGWTPLMLATFNGHHTAAQILIANRANCGVVNVLGQTALDIAKLCKRQDLVILLEGERTTRVHEIGSPKVQIDLCEAAIKGNLEQIKDLSVKDDFNVNETKEDGITPLMWATIGNYFGIVQFLIERKADVNIRDKTRGWTALMYAVTHASDTSHKGIICLLMLAGANVELKAFDGCSASDLIILNGDSEIFRLVMGADSGVKSDTNKKFIQQVLDRSLLYEDKTDISEANRQSLKFLVSKGWNKINRTVRGLNKRPSSNSKPWSLANTHTANINDMSNQLNIDCIKNSNILSGNLTNSEQITTIMLRSMKDGIDQKKTTRLPLLGNTNSGMGNLLHSPILPPFVSSDSLEMNTKQRGVTESLSTSPQDCDSFSVSSKIMGQLSPGLLNHEEQSPESSFSFSTANSPNSSFTGSINPRAIVNTRKGSWTSNPSPSQYYQNRSKRSTAEISSLPSASPPSSFSVSPTGHNYLVPKPNKTSGKRKASSLPRLGRSTVVPVYSNPVKSEPDDEQMKQLLAKLSLEKYTPIFEEHEVDMESFVTLNESDLHEIGIDQEDAKEQILAAVAAARHQQERKLSFPGVQTEAWT